MANSDRSQTNGVTKYNDSTRYKSPWQRMLLKITYEFPQYKAIMVEYKGQVSGPK